jgi:hypothetical protein
MSRRLLLACPAAGFLGNAAQDEPLLVWMQSGGIAGLCDELKVWQNGEFRATSCRPNGASNTGTLSKKDSAQIEQWRKSLHVVKVENRDSGIADGMSVSLNFRGVGQRQASDAELRSMMEWAQEIYSSRMRGK